MSVILNVDGGIDFPNGINFAVDKRLSNVGSGYQKFPSGLIIQWGLINTSVNITFPIAFPTACFNVQVKWNDGPGVTVVYSQYFAVTAVSTTGATFAALTTTPRFWFAIGN